MSFTVEELEGLAAHLGLESAKPGSQADEIILRGKNGNEARVWAWATYADDGGLEVDIGTPTCVCSACHGRGWYLSHSPHMHEVRRHVCLCGAPEKEDAAYGRTFDGERRADAAYLAHAKGGFCTLHNGRHFCARKCHVGTDGWPPSHAFTGPLVRPADGEA